jgi:hypothetical protein
MKMEAVYSSETVVRTDTVSEADSLGAIPTQPGSRPCFVPAMHLERGSLLYSMTPAAGRLEWRCADLCFVLCLCISRIGNPAKSAGCQPLIHSTPFYTGCIPLTIVL